MAKRIETACRDKSSMVSDDFRFSTGCSRKKSRSKSLPFRPRAAAALPPSPCARVAHPSAPAPNTYRSPRPAAIRKRIRSTVRPPRATAHRTFAKGGADARTPPLFTIWRSVLRDLSRRRRGFHMGGERGAALPLRARPRLARPTGRRRALFARARFL